MVSATTQVHLVHCDCSNEFPHQYDHTWVRTETHPPIWFKIPLTSSGDGMGKQFGERNHVHLLCVRYPAAWLLCIWSVVGWNLASYLNQCILSPATKCMLSAILAFWAFIFYSVKVALLHWPFYNLPCLNCLSILSSVGCMLSLLLVPLGSFSCFSVQITMPGGTVMTNSEQQVDLLGQWGVQETLFCSCWWT